MNKNKKLKNLLKNLENVENTICKLKKLGRKWYKRLNKTLKSINKATNADLCVYTNWY